MILVQDFDLPKVVRSDVGDIIVWEIQNSYIDGDCSKTLNEKSIMNTPNLAKKRWKAV